MACVMVEEMPPNEEIIFVQQSNKVINASGNPENVARHMVSRASVILWLLLALGGLDLWLLGLLGYL